MVVLRYRILKVRSAEEWLGDSDLNSIKVKKLATPKLLGTFSKYNVLAVGSICIHFSEHNFTLEFKVYIVLRWFMAIGHAY